MICSLLGLKAEESMEERKKRIMRKYAPLKTIIEQTDIEVFDEPEEDERVLESEIMQVEDLEFKREKPGQIINYNIPRGSSDRRGANWLFDLDEDEIEPEEEPKGEYWSLFGDIEEESEYKESREKIYQPHDRELRKDIFGITENVTESSNQRSYPFTSFNEVQSDSKSFSWGSSSQEKSAMPSYYIPYKSAERRNSIESAQNQMNLNSQKNAVERNVPNIPRYKSPTANSQESFTRPSLNLRPRVQLNRQDPTSSNRDFERLIEQKSR